MAFGGTRTYHRIACSIEDAGFEIRDCIMWLYGSGFPKSMNIAKALEGKLTIGSGNPKVFSKLNGEQLERGNWGIAKLQKEQGYRNKDYDIESENKTRLGNLEPTIELAKQWEGWGTCLKLAYEPIIVARKPFKGSLVDNVIENGVGGINIDECRIAFKNDAWKPQKSGKTSRAFQSEETTTAGGMCEANELGRFPSNVILTYNEEDKEEVCGGMPTTKKNGSINKKYDKTQNVYGQYPPTQKWEAYNDEGSASRYFYCAKASKKDRDEGLDEFGNVTGADITRRKEGSLGLVMKGRKTKSFCW